MPTAHTVETIYNAALDMVGELPVSLASGSVYARWLNRNFVHYVQSALREQPWNFACELRELNSTGTAPDFRWSYAYDLPNGWLRVLPPTYLGERGGQPVHYEVKRNVLLMNEGPTQRVEIVFDEQDPGQWDPLFAAVIIARLANGLAHRATAKASYVALTKEAAASAMETAETVNAFEGSLEPIEQHDIIRVRGPYDDALNRGLRR